MRTRLTRSARGAQTRHRTEPSPCPIAPHRRAGRPSFLSIMATAFRFIQGNAIDPAVGDRIDTHPDPLAAGPLLARRVLPLIPSRIALAGRGAPGGPRMLGEVTQVACPGARRFPANRAEYRVPQPAIAHHTSALIGYTRALHGRSALPQCRSTRSRMKRSDPARIRPESDLASTRLPSSIRGIRSQNLETHVPWICKSRTTPPAHGEDNGDSCQP
jgi:hypothetical protein